MAKVQVSQGNFANIVLEMQEGCRMDNLRFGNKAGVGYSHHEEA